MLGCSLTPRSRMPRVGDGPAPCSVGDTDQPEMMPSACSSDLLDFPLQLDAGQFEPEPPKFNRAGFVGDLKIASSLDDSSGDSIFAHLSGRELRGAFSRALLRSQLSGEEKGRILNEVSSLTGAARDKAMLGWIARLKI